MNFAVNSVRGWFEDFARRTLLFAPATVHQNHDIGKRHCLILSVRKHG